MYTEIFGPDQSTDLILLSSEYRENNKIKSTATNTEGLSSISRALAGDFAASLSEGAISNRKHFDEGRVTKQYGLDQWENIDLNTQVIMGKHYVVGVDENINIAVPEAGFRNLADSYVRWYEKVIDSDYVKKSRKKMKAADDLF